MNYKDVIKAEWLSEYIDQHKLFYRTLSSMIFDVSFIEACSELQNSDLDSDWVTVKFIYRNVYENLIIKVSRCFFDNSGGDATNLFKFKNRVLSVFLCPKYKENVLEKITTTGFEDKEYKKKMETLRENILGFRDDYIAHGLLSKQDRDFEVDLKDIKELLEKGCNLFQAISFEPSGFYDKWWEGDGYDFSKEFDYTKKSTKLFLKYSMLSAKCVERISCEYRKDRLEFDEENIRIIENIINEINGEKANVYSSIHAE